jgi:hypothetical protein
MKQVQWIKLLDKWINRISSFIQIFTAISINTRFMASFGVGCELHSFSFILSANFNSSYRKRLTNEGRLVQKSAVEAELGNEMRVWHLALLCDIIHNSNTKS